MYRLFHNRVYLVSEAWKIIHKVGSKTVLMQLFYYGQKDSVCAGAKSVSVCFAANIGGIFYDCKKLRVGHISANIFANFRANICGNKCSAKHSANICDFVCGNYCAAQIVPQNKAQLFADRK